MAIFQKWCFFLEEKKKGRAKGSLVCRSQRGSSWRVLWILSKRAKALFVRKEPVEAHFETWRESKRLWQAPDGAGSSRHALAAATRAAAPLFARRARRGRRRAPRLPGTAKGGRVSSSLHFGEKTLSLSKVESIISKRSLFKENAVSPLSLSPCLPHEKDQSCDELFLEMGGNAQ